MHNDEWNNERLRSCFDLVSLPLICILIYSMLFLSSTPWSIFDNFLGFKYNTALAIPNVPANNNNNNNTSPSMSTTTNYPPESSVGPDQTVNENTTVMLVGGAFDRNTNDKLNYSWIQTVGPPITLNRTDTTSTTFISPDVLSDTTLRFSLTAKDDKSAVSSPAIITVIVKPINHHPSANAGQDKTVGAGNVVSLDSPAVWILMVIL